MESVQSVKCVTSAAVTCEKDVSVLHVHVS